MNNLAYLARSHRRTAIGLALWLAATGSGAAFPPETFPAEGHAALPALVDDLPNPTGWLRVTLGAGGGLPAAALDRAAVTVDNSPRPPA